MRIAALLALLLVSCCGKPPDQKLLDDIDPAVSWVATLQFAAEKWVGNSVPTRFVRASVASAQKEIDKAKKSVEESKADAGLRERVRTQLEIANSAAGKLRAAVESGDRKMAAISISQFAAAHDALEDLKK